MPSFNTMFKNEVARLARKEVRKETEAIRKASTRHRSEIAALKRDIARLERRVKLKESGKRKPVKSPVEGSGPKPRFSPKWVSSDRSRLGLSAKHYGQLIGVTGLTVYNWEKGKSKPRDKQLAAWAAVRGLGKRAALRHLDTLES